MSDPAADARYPPAQHLLRDLRIAFERLPDGRPRLRAPIQRACLDASGALDTGVAAVLADVLAGRVAIAAVAPDWAVTSDLVLHALAAPPEDADEICAHGRVLRAGRNNIVLEAALAARTAHGEAPLAFAQLGFTRIARRGEVRALAGGPEGEGDFAAPGAGFAGPRGFWDRLSVREAAAGPGCEDAAGGLELPITSYVRNSVGGLQGGVVLGLAAHAAGRWASARRGRAFAAVDVAAHYLAMGRVGPVRSRATLLRERGDELLVRVELRDAGAGERSMMVATVRTRPLDPAAAPAASGPA